MAEAPAATLGRRWFAYALAALFAAATVLYTILWMSAVRRTPMVELGFNETASMVVTQVFRDSPAEHAGLQRGDRVVAVNGALIWDESSLYREYHKYRAGDRVDVGVERPGHNGPIVLTGVFRPRRSLPQANGWAEYFAGEIRNLYPLPFLLVGFVVLFLRVEDRHVWLLALMFASLIASAGIPDAFAGVPPILRPFAKAYQAVFLGLLGAAFYGFFAVFPIRSPIERRVPWLKWAAAAVGLTLGVAGMRTGGLVVPAVPASVVERTALRQVPLGYEFGFIALGLISLTLNYFRTNDAEAQRKMRVIFWGTVVGFGPGAARAAAVGFGGVQPPWWIDTVFVLLICIFPLAFAYAVVKHRVLEIPVLLRRSARYLLVQRGFVVLLAATSVGLTFLFASSFERYFQPLIGDAQAAGIAMGSGFGIALLWGGYQVHSRVSARIDRAFFRSAYDARLILEDLAERSRMATDRGALARLLQRHIKDALHPEFVAVYLPAGDGEMALASGGNGRLPADAAYATLQAEYVAKMPGRRGGTAGLLVVGPRLSEEPYSGEDKRLLTSVANQAATALENLTLAEEIAARREAETRAAHEMEIAKGVQLRLLPQRAPRLKTLDCAARCLQAKSVGGDYYDFLRVDEDRTALVLADVSGKGVHAALLMANLQAHLRNQTSVAPFDPVRAMRQVNRMLCESTGGQHYATMFFGVYDDAARRMVYVNCGHNPPLWMHADGTLQRLEATATVVGLFEEWECSAREVELAPGDLVVVFSDGVTEAMRGEEEFGEERLIGEVQGCAGLPVEDVAGRIFDRVVEFSAGGQSDDLTVVIARVTGTAS